MSVKLFNKKYRYRYDFRKLILLLIPVIMVVTLAGVLLYIQKADSLTPVILPKEAALNFMRELKSLTPEPLVVLTRNDQPEMYAFITGGQKISEILVDARQGSNPARVYRVKVGDVNGKTGIIAPPEELSFGQTSYDRDFVLQYPYIFYISVFAQQVQSVNAVKINDNTRQVFEFGDIVKSASLVPADRNVVNVTFQKNAPVQEKAKLTIEGNQISSNSPELTIVSDASDNSPLFIRLVEGVREHIGPGVVAFIENAWYRIKDIATRLVYFSTHGQIADQTASGLPNIASPGRDLHWQKMLSNSGDNPVLERTILNPDPLRPYVTAYLVQIDPDRVDFHLVAGTKDPHSATGIHGTGTIPSVAVVRKNVIAAFNGGFQTKDGHFGVMVSRKTFLAPMPGLATFCMYADGRVNIGSWGKEIMPSPDMLSFRQNLPLLIDGGMISPAIEIQKKWGVTVDNNIRVWRSGLGITDNGKLVYAAGDNLSAETLATALLAAGCQRAMELDINSYWVTFNIYHWVNDKEGGYLACAKLASSMIRSAKRYLIPDSRDFFYLTLKNSLQPDSINAKGTKKRNSGRLKRSV